MDHLNEYPRFTNEVRAAILRSNRLAEQLGCDYIGVGHMFVGLVEADQDIRKYLPEEYSSPSTLIPLVKELAHPEKTGSVKEIMIAALNHAQSVGSDHISPKHLFLAMVTSDDEILSTLLEQIGTDEASLEIAVLNGLEGHE